MCGSLRMCRKSRKRSRYRTIVSQGERPYLKIDKLPRKSLKKVLAKRLESKKVEVCVGCAGLVLHASYMKSIDGIDQSKI
jgi:hypothetical protein